MYTSIRLTAAVVSSLLVAVTLATPAAGTVEPRFEARECQFQMPPGQVEGVTVDCGYLVVPEDRADPSSRSIRLALAIFHPRDGVTHPVPVVYLEGGPGGSPLKLLAMRDFDGSYAPLLAQGHELILLDQRGVGRSQVVTSSPSAPSVARPALRGPGSPVAQR